MLLSIVGVVFSDASLLVSCMELRWSGVINPATRLFDCLLPVGIYRTNRIPILNSVSNVQTK